VTYSLLAFLLNITLTAALSNFYVIIPSIFVVWLSAMIIAKYDLFFDDKVEVYYKFEGYFLWEVLFWFVLLASLLTSFIVSYFAGFNFLTTFLVCYMSFRLLSKLVYNSKFFKVEINHIKLICSLLISILLIMPIFGAKSLFLGMFAKGFVLFNWSDFLNLALSSFSNPLCWLIGLICFLFIANIMISFSYDYMDENRKYNFLKIFFQKINSQTAKFTLFLDAQDKISLKFFTQFMEISDERTNFKHEFFRCLREGEWDIINSSVRWLHSFCSANHRVEFFERVANFYGLSYYLAKCIKNDNLCISENEGFLRQYLTMSKEFKTIDEDLSLTESQQRLLSYQLENLGCSQTDAKHEHVNKINFKQLEQQVEERLACYELSVDKLQNDLPQDLVKQVMSYI
jgi:hypothetical protein